MRPIQNLTMILGTILAFVVILTGSLGTSAWAQEEGEPIPFGPIVASGSVVDQDGRTLSDVEVGVWEQILTGQGGLVIKREWTETVFDGGFETSCDDCSVLRLRFSKEGFYAKVVEVVYLGETKGDLPEVIHRTGGILPTVERRGISVVLERAEHQPVNLIRMSGRLDAGPDWYAHALVVNPGRSRTVPLEVLLAKAGSGDMPEYIALEPGLDEKGALAFTSAKAGGLLRPSPAPAVIDFSKSGGGVVFYQPSTDVMALAYREMKEAPEDGYESRVVVEAGRGDDVYFYCFINGMYGKGRFTGLRFEYRNREPRGVSLGIEILLNPDGTRNLEDIRF
jgi:hypothetical protein